MSELRVASPAVSLQAGHLDRVLVVGTSCSGKSAFARRLAAGLGSPHVELDALHWLPGWQERPRQELRELARQAVEGERWVVDGNYSHVREITYPRATAVVWLNFSLPLTFSRALRRSLRRAWTGEELFSGNRESFRQTFFSRDSILLWVLTSYGRVRRGYRRLFDGEDYPHLARLELRRPRQAEEFLRRCTSPAPVAGGAVPGQE